jgi:anti-sigma regulatory factor (Ser/Thr protein kinase)
VDWAIDTTSGKSVRELRKEIISFLERHASDARSVGDVELAVSELLTNGARHAKGPLWVNIDWSVARPVLTVVDLGPGFDLRIELPPPGQLGGRGLYVVDQLTHDLAVRKREAGGSVVSVSLPIERGVTVSIDPPRRRVATLPALDEALPEGGFGKEAFLRALVVQLAHAIGVQGGPLAAEEAVAQVAADVGGQMEAEYRQATAWVGRMDADRLAECFVRLKHAIDGRFSVVEIDDHRIVLENTQCPFGAAVQHAPALCRMTSAVFGSIGASNSDHGAEVTLEERIAIGDTRCRVIVELDPGEEPSRFAHRYTSPADTSPTDA